MPATTIAMGNVDAQLTSKEDVQEETMNDESPT
jgi:hypothetical protein